jgi:hypothetical protein
MSEEQKTNEPLAEEPQVEIKQEPVEIKQEPVEEKKPKKVLSDKQKEALKRGREKRWKKEESVEVTVTTEEIQKTEDKKKKRTPKKKPSPPLIT